MVEFVVASTEYVVSPFPFSFLAAPVKHALTQINTDEFLVKPMAKCRGETPGAILEV